MVSVVKYRSVICNLYDLLIVPVVMGIKFWHPLYLIFCPEIRDFFLEKELHLSTRQRPVL